MDAKTVSTLLLHYSMFAKRLVTYLGESKHSKNQLLGNFVYGLGTKFNPQVIAKQLEKWYYQIIDKL